jgi:hypothetical protein
MDLQGQFRQRPHLIFWCSPFRDVAEHVVDTGCIWQFPLYRMRLTLTVVTVPSNLIQFAVAICCAPCAAAYSHSPSVGNLPPILEQYSSASFHVTESTGRHHPCNSLDSYPLPSYKHFALLPTFLSKRVWLRSLELEERRHTRAAACLPYFPSERFPLLSIVTCAPELVSENHQHLFPSDTVYRSC